MVPRSETEVFFVLVCFHFSWAWDNKYGTVCVVYYRAVKGGDSFFSIAFNN